MLVYGDHHERVAVAEALDRLEAERQAIAEMPAGIGRHAALASLLIGFSGLVQGVADALFADGQVDRAWPQVDALMTQLTQIGGELVASWNGRQPLSLPPIKSPKDVPVDVDVRLPEGFAFYALYPEAYGLAVRKLSLSGPPIVIGLRSIGTALAAIVAAVLGAPTPVLLRPTGHPFARQLAIDETLARRLFAIPNAHFVVVDEGPGLSGSSFGAVADWLEERGVPADRIAFLPGHGGPLGTEASERHRARWAAAQRLVVDTDALLLPDRLRTWVETLTGPLSAPLEEISGGDWRAHRFASEKDWPAVQPNWERRKFLARGDGGIWIVKFAGLGAIGAGKLALARKLVPFVPAPLGLVHGWIVERWHSDAHIVRPRPEEIGSYLAHRAGLRTGQGASLALLQAMIERNLPEASAGHDLERLQNLVRPVVTDGRMNGCEWLRLPSGELLKADALDHHAAHDLIGCQDIAWDVAGAAVELGLDPKETAAIMAQLAAATGGLVDPNLLDFYQRAYRAFRFGALTMTAHSLGGWPLEAHRNRQEAERLARRYRP